jgi:hypothetical protein
MLLLTTLLLVPCAPLPAPSAPTSVQSSELKEKIKEYGAILSSREREDEAIALIDGFLVTFKAAESRSGNLAAELEAGGDERALKKEIRELEKEMDAVVDAVQEALTHKRRKEVNAQILQLWKVAAYALGQMGERGAPRLWEAFEDKKRFGDEPDLRGLFLEQIGQTRSYAETEGLVDLLDHSEYLFIARAADALAYFGEAPGSVRRMAVDTLVKLLAEYYESHAQDPSDVEAQEKYRKTGPSMIKALEALTGTTQTAPLAWRTWFNKHKDDTELWGD